MKRITLVGCGNIGSRHLQAIAKLSFPCSVQIIEPSETAQRIAKSRLAEVPHFTNKIDFHWNVSLRDLKSESDLTIVATSSVGRVEIINQLIELGHSRFLIEKMVCQSAKDYEFLTRRMQSFNAKGWVNIPRRYYASYQNIRQHVRGDSPLQMSVVAGNEGLGSNAIHFIDLFCWFCNEPRLELSGDLLEKQLFPNKRGENLLEFAGTIAGGSAGGSSLNISFLSSSDRMPLIVSIGSKGAHIIVNETEGQLLSLTAESRPLSEEFKTEFVSNTTTRIADEILNRDACSLPTVQDSYFAHAELFRIFNAHIKKLTNEERELCPIT
ncbi:MAG: Gfo/Idh/MocA family oxidoreductase [Nitrososphaerales archaeon]